MSTLTDSAFVIIFSVNDNISRSKLCDVAAAGEDDAHALTDESKSKARRNRKKDTKIPPPP